MPKKFPPEFKRDVVTVARRGELTRAEVAADFVISEESASRWLREADIDDGVRDGLTTAEQSEIVQLCRDKRRLDGERDPAQRCCVLRQGSSPKMSYPLVRELAAEGIRTFNTVQANPTKIAQIAVRRETRRRRETILDHLPPSTSPLGTPATATA